MDRIMAQATLLEMGDAASTGGRRGKGGGGGSRKVGGTWPNNAKGRLINRNIRLISNCPIKKNMPARKLSNVPSTEKKPKLSPAGSRLTITARIKRKSRL